MSEQLIQLFVQEDVILKAEIITGYTSSHHSVTHRALCKIGLVILEELTPIGIEIFHPRIKVITEQL